MLCAFAGCTAPENALKRCAGCSKVFYCGREHQRAHWKIHKKACRKTEKKQVVSPDTLSNELAAFIAQPQDGGRSLDVVLSRALGSGGVIGDKSTLELLLKSCHAYAEARLPIASQVVAKILHLIQAALGDSGPKEQRHQLLFELGCVDAVMATIPFRPTPDVFASQMACVRMFAVPGSRFAAQLRASKHFMFLMGMGVGAVRCTEDMKRLVLGALSRLFEEDYARAKFETRLAQVKKDGMEQDVFFKALVDIPDKFDNQGLYYFFEDPLRNVRSFSANLPSAEATRRSLKPDLWEYCILLHHACNINYALGKYQVLEFLNECLPSFLNMLPVETQRLIVTLAAAAPVNGNLSSLVSDLAKSVQERLHRTSNYASDIGLRASEEVSKALAELRATTQSKQGLTVLKRVHTFASRNATLRALRDEGWEADLLDYVARMPGMTCCLGDIFEAETPLGLSVQCLTIAARRRHGVKRLLQQDKLFRVLCTLVGCALSPVFAPMMVFHSPIKNTQKFELNVWRLLLMVLECATPARLGKEVETLEKMQGICNKLCSDEFHDDHDVSVDDDDCDAWWGDNLGSQRERNERQETRALRRRALGAIRAAVRKGGVVHVGLDVGADGLVETKPRSSVFKQAKKDFLPQQAGSWLPNVCATCALPEPAPKKWRKCGRCEKVFYCSEICQHTAWPHHKVACKK